MNELSQYIDRIRTDEAVMRIVLCLLLAGFSCSLLSAFSAVKRMTLASAGIGSAAFVGAVAALTIWPSFYITDWQVQAVAAGSAFFIAAIVLWANRNTTVSLDAILGLFVLGVFGLGLLATMEWGIEIPDQTLYLFKTPNISSPIDLYILAGLAALVSPVMLLFHRKFTIVCIDSLYARSIGIRPNALEFLFVAMLTATILLSIYCAGLMFTLTLLILPGICARMTATRMSSMTLSSLGIGLFSCAASAALAYTVELPTSIVLAGILFSIFVLLFGANRIRSARTARIH